MNRFVEPSVTLSVLISACVTERAPEPSCVIPVPYVKCVLVLAAVVKRLVEPSVTLSVLTSTCVTVRVYVPAVSS